MAQGFATSGNIVISGGATSLNSSTTPLNAAATFTGTWEDVSAYSSVVISCKTDQDGVYTIDFSPDGINADSSLLRYYRTNQIEPPHRFTVTRKYMRVRFQNTSLSNQTYFRLQTLLGSQGDLNIPLDSTMSQDYDSISVRPSDYKYEVALGRRQGVTTWNKFGYNDDIDIGTEVIWSVGGLFTRLNTASTFTVVSSSVQDILTSGTGAWNIVLYYIDANRLAATEVIPLNGTTPVVSVGTGLGINRVALYNTGSGDTNAGTITITATTGGTTQAQIPIGTGTSQQAVFFTQDNHNALMDWLVINVNKAGGGTAPKITVKGWVYSYVSTAKYLVFQHSMDTSVENTAELRPSQPFVVGEKSVFWLECTTDQNNTVVNARFSLIEVKDVNA